MQFLRHKSTGKLIEHDAVLYSDEERAQYEKVYDYPTGYLRKINEKLGWILAIFIIQIICGMVAAIMYL